MPARLTVIRGRDIDQVYTIEDRQASVLGRSIKCDIRLPDGRASRSHCRIEHVGGQWIITDNGSRNGTYVNKQKVAEATLESGQTIRVGATALKFTIDGEPDRAGPEGTEALLRQEDIGPRPPEEVLEPQPEAEVEPEDLLPLDDDSQPVIELEAAEEEEGVCAQCGRELASDALDAGEATEIGGRLYCSRCVVHHSESDHGIKQAEPAESSDSSEFQSLLRSLERATEADQLGSSPEPPPDEPPPPKRRHGLLDRLRGKRPKE